MRSDEFEGAMKWEYVQLYIQKENVKFEWDPEKNKQNLEKHYISFEEAKETFLESVMLSRPDNRKNYNEKRTISIGALSKDILIIVVHTRRKNKIRLISCRLANKKERKIYNEALKKKKR